MTTQQSHTPDEVEINPRDYHAEFGDVLATDYVGNCPFRTALYNALSISFPEGELFFVESARHFRKQIKDKKLLKEVSGFCGQELLHTREHNRYNDVLFEARGYDKEKLTSIGVKSKAKLDKLPPLDRLAITAAAEHYTAIMGEFALKDPRWLEDMDPAIRKVWHWHGLEELEHKAVCFDLYKAMGGGYWRRIKAMYTATIWFGESLSAMKVMLESDGKGDKKTWNKGMKFYFGRGGLGWTVIGAILSYLKPGFHPWKSHDTRSLLADWKQRLGFA